MRGGFNYDRAEVFPTLGADTEYESIKEFAMANSLRERLMRRAALQLAAVVFLSAGCFGNSRISARNDRSPGDDWRSTMARDSCAMGRDPGRVTIHRLNRAEYNNTVRDLLSDDTSPAQDFPSDDFGYGFDNIADVLSTSPLLVEKFETTAENLIEAAWARDAPGCRSPAIRICEPGEDRQCGRNIITRFARRAWRRPASAAEIAQLISLFNVAAAQGDPPEVGVKLALRAILVSPHFLYRIEGDDDPQSNTAHFLNDYELATRLSYFLWSSTPDGTLSALADDGTLHKPAVIEAQVRRMLRDPKSSALQENFVGEWLYTRALDSVQPDARLYPQFDDELKWSMQQETELFYRSLIDENRDALDLLDSDYTFVNARLADHYGLPGVSGTEMRRVSLQGTQRRGILSQASFLAVTSHPNRTSPVKRGKWVMGQLLCTEPPPPPPNIPPLPEGEGQGGTLRERMQAHRANPTCASCHAVMDPIGFGLENFDAVGHWRELDAEGMPIDASGVLPNERAFSGAKELASLLKQDDHVPACFVRQLLTYALGRGTTRSDECAIADMTEAFQSSGNHLADLFQLIATSDPFMRRRGELESAP